MDFGCRPLLLGLLLLLPLLGCSAVGADSPFSPRASLIRQWRRLFGSEQMPSILLDKASPLNATQVAVFSRYIVDGTLPSHLRAFCSAAKLLCDVKTPANVTSDVSGDADFESYSNKDFRRYQKGTVFGSDNFKNYSVDENVARDTFVRYGKDGSGTEQFTNYALSTNVAGSGFTSYDDNSNAGSGIFRSYGMQSNVQGHDFAAYGTGSSGVLHTFASYSEDSNVVKNDFKDYGKDTNAMSSTFTGYSGNSNVNKNEFKGYGKDGNGMSSTFTSYSNNSNVGTSTFKGYSAGGNGGTGMFQSYGESENIARSDFLSYGNDGNGDFNQFSSYGEQASQSDNSFRSYAKGNNAPFEDFSNYGNSTTSSKNEFVEYNKDAGGVDPFLRFTTYVGNQTSFKQYFRTPGTFIDYFNSSQASAAANVEPGKFFRRTNLAEGKRIPMPDIRDKMPPRSFLPRALAERLPFGSARLPELVRLLGAADLQGSMAKTVAECERPAVKDETKRCPTSLEAMAEFAASVLGKSAAVSTTASTAGWGKTLVVGKVAPRRGGGETAAVSCHQSLFPYLVYYCHAVPRVAVYDVELKEDAGGEAVNHGVAICHLDTTQWSAGHAAFVALGPAPGKIEVCHWIFENDLIWVARDG
ncbi:unnamed protein product [Spirodela intermedia]|uniref:BURP domain-containing protein n=1 Tax=Spirodela intermedia TaxID=51605 RepID=A0A7I8L184_SPIIN|nr:unnamed protein product [Spirodela intermedia]